MVKLIRYLKDTDMLHGEVIVGDVGEDVRIRDRFAWGYGEFDSMTQVTWKLGNILREESSDTFEVRDSDGKIYYEGDNCFYGWFLDMPANFVRGNEMFFFENRDKKVVHRTERFKLEAIGHHFQLDSYDID